MFETSLVESRKRDVGGKRWLSLPLSFLIHSSVLGTALAASAWYVDDPPEPATPAVFFEFDRPGGAPSGSPARPAAAAMSSSAPASALQAPIPRQVALVPEAPARPGEGAETGPAGEPRDGDGDGDGGDTGYPFGNPRNNGPAPQPDQQRIFIPGGEVTEPIETFRVQPDYPETARKAHMEGVVIIQAVITRGGGVESVQILRGLNPLLDRAAMEAVARWRYRPATFRGTEVPVYLTVTVTFQIQKG